MTRRSTTARADEEFDVAVSARYRRGKYPDIRAPQRGRKSGDVAANLLMHGGVADNPALEMFAAGFELWLDQRKQMHRRCGQRQRNRQYRFQRNEADVDDDDVWPGREPLALELADVHSFHGNDLGMLAQGRMQLSVAD